MSIFVKDACTYDAVLQHVTIYSSQFFLAYCDVFIAKKHLDFEFKLIIKSDF